MKKITIMIIGLMSIFLCGLIATFHLGLTVAAIIFKTLASISFCALGFVNYKNPAVHKSAGKQMLAAFFCSLCGDVLLAVDKDNGIMFVIGVVSFAAAHILFATAFCRIRRLVGADVLITCVIFAITLGILIFGGEFDYQGLFAVLVGYSAIISFMVAKAVSLRKSTQISQSAAKWIAVGAVFFLLSDIILLYWLFGINMPKIVQSLNWVFYYAAQGCLAVSLGKMRFTEQP